MSFVWILIDMQVNYLWIIGVYLFLNVLDFIFCCWEQSNINVVLT